MTMTAENKMYHYTECGLDDVYLLGGHTYHEGPRGRQVTIRDIDGLHHAIGRYLMAKKKVLSGKDIQFLRHEMLMSQNTLAELVGVSEQTIRRWEHDKTDAGPAISIIRLLYKEHLAEKGKSEIRKILERVAKLEDSLDRSTTFKETEDGWAQAA